jgi:hypothetical protein
MRCVSFVVYRTRALAPENHTLFYLFLGSIVALFYLNKAPEIKKRCKRASAFSETAVAEALSPASYLRTLGHHIILRIR